MARRLRDDRRAIATALIVFIGILTLSAIFYAFLNPVLDGSKAAMDNQTTSQQSQDVLDARFDVWEYLLFYSLFLAGIALLARAVFESRGPG